MVALALSVPAAAAQAQDSSPERNSVQWQSDGFDTANLGTAGWSVVSERARGLATIENSTLVLRASGDVAADSWRRHDSLHLTRPAPDTDVVMRATFGSVPNVPYEAQGIAFINSPFDFLRIDVISDENLDRRLYAASSSLGVPVVHADVPIEVSVPYDLQIRRDGDLWTVFVIDADRTADLVASFVHPLVINSYGPFATSREAQGQASFIGIDILEGGGEPVIPMAVDEVRPLLQGAVADNTDAGPAIAWTTDETTTGFVRATASDGSTTDLSTPAGFDHRIVFTDALLNEPYDFDIVATDAAGNASTAKISNHIWAPSSVPVIEIYGGRDRQFGFTGDPQPTVSITGVVRSPTGNFSVFWKLDDGEFEELQPDPASTRIISKGEFSIELEKEMISSELEGTEMVIEAREAPTTLEVELDDGTVQTEIVPGATNSITLKLSLLLPVDQGPDRTVTWGGDDLDLHAQIANGGWHLVPGGVAPLEPGPQRILLIGDQSWSNYEVELSFVPGDLAPADAPEPVLPWAGVYLGWRGFDPVSVASNDVLRTAGGAGFGQGDGGVTVVGIRDETEFIANSGPIELTPGVRYRMRAQAKTVREGTEVRMRMWIDGEPEPDHWTVETINTGAPNGGSLALVAHRWDIVFGTVTITPL